jgi:hypothetical protein
VTIPVEDGRLQTASLATSLAGAGAGAGTGAQRDVVVTWAISTGAERTDVTPAR